MARKPAKMYRQIKGPAFTRREYMGGVPNKRILRFHLGNKVAAERGEFPIKVTLTSENAVQVRHTALEAGRMTANMRIRNAAGSLGYSLQVRVYPHHVLRENKQATGAGADRVSQGMQQAFGKNVGTAARVKAGQALVTINCHPEHFIDAKDALRKASMKFPTPCRMKVEKGAELLKGIA